MEVGANVYAAGLDLWTVPTKIRPRFEGAWRKARPRRHPPPRAEFEVGLTDIEGLSHFMVIWAFDRSHGFDLLGTPPVDNRPHGVFATRSPRRPFFEETLAVVGGQQDFDFGLGRWGS